MNGHAFDPEKHVDELLLVRVKEQQMSNLMQSILVVACVGVTCTSDYYDCVVQCKRFLKTQNGRRWSNVHLCLWSYI